MHKTMRDAFLDEVHRKMRQDKKIFFLCADFGAPVLDKIRRDFPQRFINVGIAEQNMINIATGLSLEGFKVFTYAIAPFLTMRSYEQNRVNLSIHSQVSPLNVNLIGVGAGVSYEVSGPTHHCLEDISIMRLLPNFMVFSPSDWVLAAKLADACLNLNCPKYLRFDAKPLMKIYGSEMHKADFEKGYSELAAGRKVCLVATGYMTHTALSACRQLQKDGFSCGVLDVFRLKPLNEEGLGRILKKYDNVVTMEEAFIEKGGLDSAVLRLLHKKGICAGFSSIGFKDKYDFRLGNREHLHRLNGIDTAGVVMAVKKLMQIKRGRKR
ncbi:MAG: transketolase [Candidatus Omnitrophica bacterium]|nr:transketolase [Candidatus Omnitrophota bacterium]